MIELVSVCGMGSEVNSRVVFCLADHCSNWKLSVVVFGWRERLLFGLQGVCFISCVLWELQPGSVTESIPAHRMSVSLQD